MKCNRGRIELIKDLGKEGNIMDIYSVLVIIAVWVLWKWPSWKSHNRTCPPGMKADWQRMSLDNMNGVSQREIDRRFVNGWYDIPDK